MPRKFQGQRSLVGYSQWGHQESDTTEPAHTNMQNLKKKKKDTHELIYKAETELQMQKTYGYQKGKKGGGIN